MIEDEDLFYDDKDAVDHIRKTLTPEISAEVSEDDIYYVIDTVYDFYEESGFMSDDCDDNEQVSFTDEEIIEFVIKSLAKDKEINLSKEAIEAVVLGELSYCESLGIF